uniref:Timeless n=1 Tax=Chilo suppressalis TaxID=168631 RepID=A0A4D6UZ17_CHISP|nr:timeless [Chilo suppressalis]
MEWVLRSPQIHSTFGNLGYSQGDRYHVNKNCNSALETILHNILSEDKYLRTYRRNISFGQHIKKDLIPLLLHASEDKTVELLIRVLVNLTIPVECLLSMNAISKTDFGRHTIFEINNLLAETKTAFADRWATRVIIGFLKKNIEVDRKAKLSPEQCDNISNSLLLLRNILHIPEEFFTLSPNCNGTALHGIQNQILWNIFSQGIDKVLIKLMIIPDATKWAVTMVQLIALLYKDQHVVMLHKLLNQWLEASLSESSEDNESNTSPPGRDSEGSSPMLTSDPTSDSSDNGGSGKSNDETNVNSVINDWNGSSANNSTENSNEPFQPPPPATGKQTDKIISDYNEHTNKEMDFNNVANSSCTMSGQSDQSKASKTKGKNTIITDNSDCGYGTQIDTQGSISTSSNEDELPTKEPVHQKPHNPKQRINYKARSGTTTQDGKRKKLVKRGKANILNVQGLFHKTPNDDDISNVLKEFTVDFLFKGYNSLVKTLQTQIVINLQLEIDTSHFFWLVTYFLKFATQIELDLKHVCSVLSFDIASYLTAEGVNLCEQFELAMKLDGNDLKPSIRRLHLVVTAIREFVQAVEVYKKFTHICQEDQNALVRLQIQICDTEELRSLLVLLLRHYNPKYHSKQYLQDLIVTNHILLRFLDNVMKLPEYTGTANMLEHMEQFATSELMYKYGLLLEDYAVNGEFINDCIFTLMHHVGGEIGSLITLFQPKILKTFTSIWKSEFEICDDWSDLIEYVINTFITKPQTLHTSANFRLDTENFDDDNVIVKPDAAVESFISKLNHEDIKKKSSAASTSLMERDRLSSLSWNYMQCSTQSDPIGELVKIYKEDGIVKSRDSIIKELLERNLIDKETFDKFSKGESERCPKNSPNKEIRDDEIIKMCEQLTQDGKSKFLVWVQKVLLETCYAKICIKKRMNYNGGNAFLRKEYHIEDLGENTEDLPVVSPVSFHSLLCNQSVPLVPWNCDQAAICKDLKFLQLLHKLGFHMPVDSGKVFIRIPHFWNAVTLYEVAGKILPIDESQLKFSINDITDSSGDYHINEMDSFVQSKDLSEETTLIDNPEPGSSFNSDIGEPEKPTWFELIKKSQEYKLTLNLEGHVSKAETELDSDVEMSEAVQTPRAPVLAAAPPPFVPPSFVPPPYVPPPFVPHSLLMPVLSTAMVVQQSDINNFNVRLAEPDYYNHSVCETASVASDLTRMYVSDEDEKPEVLIRPVSPATEDSLDLGVSRARKRPRV